MRSLAVFFLAIWFMSVSAFTIHDKTNASLPAAGYELAALFVQPASGGILNPENTGAAGEKTDFRESGCACEQKSDTQTLTCGVTVALSDQKSHGDIAAVRQAWDAFVRTDRNRQLLYLLKRPPRNRLQS